MKRHRSLGSLTLSTVLLLTLGSGCGVNDTEAPSSTAGNAGTGGAYACAGQDCSGHGLCALAGESAVCACDEGFHAVGLSCEQNSLTDPCAGVDCGPGGVCAATGGSPVCACGLGYHNLGTTTCVPDDPGPGGTGGSGGAGGTGGTGASSLRLDGGLQSGTVTFDGKVFVPLLPYLTDGEAVDSFTNGVGIPIADTDYDELYQLETWVPSSAHSAMFEFPVSNGDYTVHLHFVDWVDAVPVGGRVFDVELEGQEVISDLDITAEVGHSAALVKSFDVTVSDGAISLELIEPLAEIAAVEIVPQGESYLGEGGGGTGGTGGTSGTGGASGAGGSGAIVENSIDAIIADREGANIGCVAGLTTGFGQFNAWHPKAFPLDGSFPRVNDWYEVCEEGDCSSCSPTVNTASNTAVEVGSIRAWIYYENGGWLPYDDAKEHGGTRHPSTHDPFYDENYWGCGDLYNPIRNQYPNTSVEYGLSQDGFGVYGAEHYWSWHGWGQVQHTIDYAKSPKAVLVTMYARLALVDAALPDDRSNARYVIHMSADKKETSGLTVQGDIGISRWKRVTSDWQPFNFLTWGWSKAEFTATNPPVVSTP